MKRFATMLVAVVLVATACGGDSGDDGAVATPSGSTGGSSASTPAAANSAGGERFVRVTVGDQQYEFETLQGCLAAVGSFQAVATASDGSGIEISIDLPPVNWETWTEADGPTKGGGWEPPVVRLEDPVTGAVWEARTLDQSEIDYYGIADGESHVDAYTVEGSSVTGTATFSDTRGLQDAISGVRAEKPAPQQGSFEASCGT